MLRKSLFFILFFYRFFLLNAQVDSLNQKPYLFAGFGNYEYAHAGVGFPVGHSCYLEMALGIKPYGFKKFNFQEAYLSFGRKLLREKPRKLNLFIHMKVLVWHFNNQYNEFVVLGVNPELRLTYTLNNKTIISLNGGLIYNAPLYYERKTYLEVGWPHEWQPSFSLQIFYRIK